MSLTLSNIDLDFQQDSVQYNHIEEKSYVKGGTFHGLTTQSRYCKNVSAHQKNKNSRSNLSKVTVQRVLRCRQNLGHNQ